MAKIKSLHDLYVAQLKDLYYAEKQLVKALPKMAKASTDPKLAKGFTSHLAETKTQVERLEQVFEMLEIPAKAVKCEAIIGILKEATEMMDETKGTDAADAALIMAAQKAEHYEITTYGSVITFAKALGYTEQANLLKLTIAEEKACDETLTKQAESSSNQVANSNSEKSTKRAA